MNFKLTVVLTILLLAALLAYMLTPPKADPGKAPPAGAATALFDPKPSDVVSITFSRWDVEESKFVKDGNQWKIATLKNVDADNGQLSSIASSLQGLAYTSKFAPEPTGARSADYTGVAKPLFTIK